MSAYDPKRTLVLSTKATCLSAHSTNACSSTHTKRLSLHFYDEVLFLIRLGIKLRTVRVVEMLAIGVK